MFCGSVGVERSGKGRDTEEIDKAIARFGKTLIKLAKTAEETLTNEILFCQRGNWYDRCTVKKNHDKYLLLRPGCSSRRSIIHWWLPCFSRMIIIYIILRRCMKLIRVVNAFLQSLALYMITFCTTNTENARVLFQHEWITYYKALQ